MNRYQLLKQNEEINYKYIKNGILSYQLIRDIEIYEAFMNSEDDLTNEFKYILIGDTYELSGKRIEQIILAMQKTIK